MTHETGSPSPTRAKAARLGKAGTGAEHTSGWGRDGVRPAPGNEVMARSQAQRSLTSGAVLLTLL